MAIDDEFPILEYLIVDPLTKDSTVLVLPETLQVPHLRHLMLGCFVCPMRSRLHPTATGLVTLYLIIDHQSAYFQPNVLLQWISFMPQLESFEIAFSFPVPNRDAERQLTHTPVTTHITLPNLRLFWFRGVCAYLEAVVCRITAPPRNPANSTLQATHVFGSMSPPVYKHNREPQVRQGQGRVQGQGN